MGDNNHHALFFQLPVPVSFRCLDHAFDEGEYATQVVSIFQNGFVISSPRSLRTGCVLLLRLRVPTPTGLFEETRCEGRVVSQQTLNEGGIGYKVEIDSPIPSYKSGAR